MPANLSIGSARDATPALESHRQPAIYPDESHTKIFRRRFATNQERAEKSLHSSGIPLSWWTP